MQHLAHKRLQQPSSQQAGGNSLNAHQQMEGDTEWGIWDYSAIIKEWSMTHGMLWMDLENIM